MFIGMLPSKLVSYKIGNKNSICFHCVCVLWVCSVVSNLLWPHGLEPVRLFSPWYSPGKNTKADCHFLLQGLFPTQGLDLHLLCILHCRQILYCCITLNLLNGLLKSTLLLECFFPHLHEAVCCCSLVTSFCSNVITCSDVCPQKDLVRKQTGGRHFPYTL